MRIEFKGGVAMRRRWMLELAARLETQGRQVTFDLGADRAPRPEAAGLGLLLALESLLYGLPRAGPSASAEWPRPSGAEKPCDLIIDFDGEALGNAIKVSTLTPLYDGAPSEAAVMDALFDGRAPRLSIALRQPGAAAARIVAAALPALEEPLIVTRSLDRALSRMGGLIAQTVGRLASGKLDSGGTIISAPARSPSLGALRSSAFLASGLARKIARRLTKLVSIEGHWRIGWRWTSGDEAGARLAWPAAAHAFLPDDGKRFYADPFIFWRDGVAHIFCEEYPYATRKGVISVFTIGRDGVASTPQIVLERPYHLSYPMVFERGGAIYMIPETSAKRAIELYRATRFPDEWTLESVLVDGVSAADATLLERDGRLWLFAALAEDGASSWDALGLFQAESLMGPWTAHPGNPVLIDAAAARPGGMVFERQGALIRPAQDCTGGYGSALALCRVDRLDPERYAQTTLAKLAPPPAWGAEGAHTLNAAGGLEVIDGVGWRSRRA